VRISLRHECKKAGALFARQLRRAALQRRPAIALRFLKASSADPRNSALAAFCAECRNICFCRQWSGWKARGAHACLRNCANEKLDRGTILRQIFYVK